jgi:hypothetical protein
MPKKLRDLSTEKFGIKSGFRDYTSIVRKISITDMDIYYANEDRSTIPGSNPNFIEETTTTTTTTSTTTTTTTVTPTTTTTSTTTTTTTEPLPPGVYSFSMKYSAIGSTEACAEASSSIYYSNSATLETFFRFATDTGLAIDAPIGYYCLAAGCPNSSGKQWIQVASAGSIVGSSNC